VVLTLTPHIIRIPDVTEEDLTPVYVGTDANISFQGTPRIESPVGAGPFDFGRREPVVPRVTPVPATTPVPQNLAPASPPSDIFRPAPRPTPGPGASSGAGAAESQSAPSVDSGALDTSGAAVFDFDPPSVSLAPGQQRSILVRATGNRTLSNASLVIRFDAVVVAAVAVRPILTSGLADARVESGRVVVDISSPLSLSGTQAVAEIVLQGIAAGQSTLSFEKAPDGAGSIPAAVEVR
jgi:hypothetical protein